MTTDEQSKIIERFLEEKVPEVLVPGYNKDQFEFVVLVLGAFMSWQNDHKEKR